MLTGYGRRSAPYKKLGFESPAMTTNFFCVYAIKGPRSKQLGQEFGATGLSSGVAVLLKLWQRHLATAFVLRKSVLLAHPSLAVHRSKLDIG